MRGVAIDIGCLKDLQTHHEIGRAAFSGVGTQIPVIVPNPKATLM